MMALVFVAEVPFQVRHAVEGQQLVAGTQTLLARRASEIFTPLFELFRV